MGKKSLSPTENTRQIKECDHSLASQIRARAHPEFPRDEEDSACMFSDVIMINHCT